MDPTVSVIITTKNRAHYLSFAIQSVLDQTFEDFEIIVVDAASTDNTREVISKFDDERIHYIYEEKDRGVSASRNTGIKHSRGEFIAFLDDDDLWLQGKLERQLDLINEEARIGFVSTGACGINKNGQIRGFWIPRLRGNIFPRILRNNIVGNCSMVLIRRECIKKTGLFDESLPAGEDFDLWIRLAKYYQFDCVREPLVSYRVHKKRISEDPYKTSKAKELLYEKHLKELLRLSNYRKVLAFWHYDLGMDYCRCGKMKQGRRELVKAVAYNPFSVLYYGQLFTCFFGEKVFNSLIALSHSFFTRLVRGFLLEGKERGIEILRARKDTFMPRSTR